MLPKSALGRAVFYALKNWDALCRYTEQGYLAPDNNFAEQILRPCRRKKSISFCRLRTCWPRCRHLLFPGRELQTQQSEPIDYLPYLTYALSHVRDKRVTLLTPDEFNASNITQIG